MLLSSRPELNWRDLMHSDSFKTAMLVSGFIAAGAVAGLVIATGKIILIGLVLGCLMSVILFSIPSVAVWLVVVGTLLVTSPLKFHIVQLDRLDWLFSVLGMFLLVCGLLHTGLSKPGERIAAPRFVSISLVVFLLGLCSLVWQEDSIEIGLAGLKRYFQFFGLIYALAYVPFTVGVVRSCIGLVLAIACLQLPYVLYQRFWLVPNRGLTFDAILGTFETVEGVGLSGSLAYLQVAVLAGLLSAWREGMLSLRSLIVLSAIVGAPLFIAEVNVIFFALPLAIGTVLLDVLKRNPLAFIGSFVGLLLAIGILGSGYLIWQQDSGVTGGEMTVQDKVANLIEYNFGEQAYGSGDKVGLNRTTVYPFWLKHHGLHNPDEFAFGHGIGSAWARDSGNPSVITRYGNYNLGLTSASVLLWELGVVGLLLYLLMLLSAWKAASKVLRDARTRFDRFLTRSLLASASLSVLYLFYTDAMVWAPSQEVLTGLTLGLIAWVARQSAASGTQTVPGAPMAGNGLRPGRRQQGAGVQVPGGVAARDTNPTDRSSRMEPYLDLGAEDASGSRQSRF